MFLHGKFYRLNGKYSLMISKDFCRNTTNTMKYLRNSGTFLVPFIKKANKCCKKGAVNIPSGKIVTLCLNINSNSYLSGNLIAHGFG